MAARIEDRFMTAEYGERVVVTARYSPDAAADNLFVIGWHEELGL